MEPWELENNEGPDMNADPLEFWQAMKKQSRFPNLERLMKKILGIPSANAAAERVFSFTGNRVGKKQARMSQDELNRLTMTRAINNFKKRYQ